MSSDSDYSDSDRELQAAFKAGLLKPGLNLQVPAEPRKEVNDADGMERCLQEFKSTLPWSERLDVVVNVQKSDETSSETTKKQNLDDFAIYERMYKQAQAAVLIGIPRLHKLDVVTQRPNDYYAEMVKTDAHMQRARQRLIQQSEGLKKSEQAKKARQSQKDNKKIKQAVNAQRQKERRKFNEQVTKFRKGQSDSLDFLEGSGNKSKDKQHPPHERNFMSNKKRQYKDKKYGHGGQKKRSKHNTAASSTDTSDFSVKKHSQKSGKGAMKKKQRLGKNRRMKERTNR